MHEISEWLVWLTAEYLDPSRKPAEFFSRPLELFSLILHISLSLSFLSVIPSPFKQLDAPSLFPEHFSESVYRGTGMKQQVSIKACAFFIFFFFFFPACLVFTSTFTGSFGDVCVCVCLLLCLSVRLWPWPLQSSCTNIYLISNGQHNAQRSERNNNLKLADGD